MARRKDYLPIDPKVPTELLTKRDAAHRELNVAIDLLIEGRDPVAIHVLTMAAFDIVEGVARKLGVETMFEAGVTESFSETAEAYRNTIRRPYTFMKHGGPDLEQFAPDLMPIYLVVAASTYWQVYDWPVDGWLRLIEWCQQHRPELVPVMDVTTGGPMTKLERRPAE